MRRQGPESRLQILADLCRRRDDADAVPLELVGAADAAEHQQLRRAQRARAEHDLGGNALLQPPSDHVT